LAVQAMIGARGARIALATSVIVASPFFELTSTGRTGSLPAREFERAVRALVQIDASGCPGSGRRSQGFLMARDQVLTVRHGIAGCGDITVSFFGGADHSVVQKTMGAGVAKVLASADLVLLKLESPVTDVAPLPVLPRRPEPNTAIFAVARWSGAPGVRDMEMRVANGSGRLRAIVNDKARHELEVGGSPSLDLEIVNLDVGVIVHGTSGAPIVDDSGTVVAIADGGLNDGFAGINWAVPTSELGHLLQSNEDAPDARAGQLAASHFSAQIESTPGSAMICSRLLLARIGSRTFNDLVEASDDPGGLRSVAGANLTSAMLARFDVYVNLRSGAAVAVPEGAKLESRGDHCVAVLGSGSLTLDLHIYTTPGTPSPEMEAAARRYDAERMDPPYLWAPVPAFTYPMALSRYDGLVVRRKNLWRFDAGDMLPADSLFETLAARGDLLLAYSITYRSPGLVSKRLAVFCGPNPYLEGCHTFLSDLEQWGKAAIAVHATTFARGNLHVAAARRNDDENSSP
jgi:Trypsin-like peptidase domain